MSSAGFGSKHTCLVIFFLTFFVLAFNSSSVDAQKTNTYKASNLSNSKENKKKSQKAHVKSWQDEPLTAYKQDSLWHFINHRGKEIFPPKLIEDVGGYSENFLRVMRVYQNRKRWMFLKTDGETVILPECDLLDNFSEGLALTIKIIDPEKEKALYGFVDTEGRQIVPTKYDDATPFTNGLAWIMDKEKRGYINKQGKMAFTLKDALGYQFSDGIAPISNEKYQVGYIDTAGNLLIDLKYNEPMPFSEGLVSVQSNERYGYINQNDIMTIAPNFDDVRPFKEDRAFVGYFDDDYHIKWGLIDKSGKMLVDALFDQVRDFNDGIAAVKVGMLWGFIDKEGKYIIEPKYSFADSFSNGLAWASIASENKRGFIDTSGEFIIEIPKSEKIIDLRWNRRVY